MCVCTCVREREIEKKIIFVCVCQIEVEEGERERERCTNENKMGRYSFVGVLRIIGSQSVDWKNPIVLEPLKSATSQV